MLTSSRQCRCCGATFAQLLSLACDRPDMAPEDLPVQDNAAILAEPGDVLTEDFCRAGDYFFLRAVLAIPLANSGGAEFILGTWASVGQEVFEEYLDRFELRETGELGKAPAWLSNAIPPGHPEPAACMLEMKDGGEYPELHLSEAGHPVYPLQKHGAQLEELLDLLHAYGHDLPSLVYDA